MEQYWLTIIIVVILIAGIVVDGIRRMRKARYDSLQMKLKPTKKKNKDVSDTEEKHDKEFGSEFPNGGARISNITIDPDRIKEVRKKYNFGSDMTAWRERVVEKIAEHTGKLHPQDDDFKSEERIEPSFEADPLMDFNTSDKEQDIDVDAVYSKSVPLENIEDADDSSDEKNFDYELYDKADAALNDYVENSQKEIVRNKPKGRKTELDEPVADETEIKQQPSKPPVQVSLNLDESVPMLMDTFDEKQAANKPAKKPAKKIFNPFSKPLQSKNNDNSKHKKSPESLADKKPAIGGNLSSNNAKAKASPSRPSIPDEVLVIHVHAAQDNVFYGNDLLELILEHGLRFGAMDIFHCHAGEDGEGPILFSLSNMVKPGIFDLHTFDEFSTVGVSLFLALPLETGSYMEAFEAMLATAKDIATQLQGELKDENRSVLTGQTIEHYRERIRDFSRRQQLEKHKL